MSTRDGHQRVRNDPGSTQLGKTMGCTEEHRFLNDEQRANNRGGLNHADEIWKARWEFFVATVAVSSLFRLL